LLAAIFWALEKKVNETQVSKTVFSHLNEFEKNELQMFIQVQEMFVKLTTCRGYLLFWKKKDTKRIEGVIVV